jgi:hypothetical protein
MNFRFGVMAMTAAAAIITSQAASAASTPPLTAFNYGSGTVGFFSETSGSGYYAVPPWGTLGYNLGNSTPIAPTAAVAVAVTTNNSFGYLGTDNHLHVANISPHADVDATAVSTGGSPATGIPASPGSALTNTFTNNANAYFYVANNHIVEVLGQINFPTFDLTALAGAPLAASSTPLAALSPSGALAVYYIDIYGHIDVVGSSGWRDLSVATGGALPRSSSAITALALSGNSVRIYYIDVNNHIRQFAGSTASGSWSSSDISGGNPVASPGSGLTSFLLSSNSFRIYYQDINNHIRELAWAGGWGGGDITSSTGAINATGGSALSAATSNGVNGIFYFGTDGAIHELLWHGGWSTANTGHP